MTNKQIEREVRRALAKYKDLFRMQNWVFYFGFSDEPEGDFVRARVLSRPWEYRQASIEFYPVNMRADTKEEIHEHVKHELLHVLVGEMREKAIAHEERVVCGLCDIIGDLEAKLEKKA